MPRVRTFRGSWRRRARSLAAGVVGLVLASSALRPDPALAAATPAATASEIPPSVPAVPALTEATPRPAPPSWSLAPTPPASPAAEEPAQPPLIERWWFWSAVAAVGITAFVIVAATSLSNPGAPSTELGNRVAF